MYLNVQIDVISFNFVVILKIFKSRMSTIDYENVNLSGKQ